MSLLHVLQYPDPRLRNKAKPVEQVDDAIRKIVADMFETMYEANGVGLAATQVNIAKCILVMDTSEERNHPICLINPDIIAREGKQKSTEGCISFPGVWEKVDRASKVTVRALNEQGEAVTHEFDDLLLAACTQHENDHLDGKLFIDHLSPLRRHMILKKFKKQSRQTF